MAVVRLRERLIACPATESLIAFPISPEFGALCLAVVARHFDPCFLRVLEPKWQRVSNPVFGSYPMTFPVNGGNRLRGGILDLVGRGGNRTPGEKPPDGSRGTIPHAQET